MKQLVKGVLFDLDGTLLDTAPDMALALNLQREHHGLKPLPYSEIRPFVSHGALAMLKLGFGINSQSANYNNMRQQYLKLYADNLAVNTQLFDGLDVFLKQLEDADIKWGVVTNKPEFLTKPLLNSLQLDQRTSSIISGDTITPRKPNPAPLFAACKESDIAPTQCIYIGDAERDITAGRASGMKTILAGWGYITPEDKIESWKADHIVDDSDQLSNTFWQYFHNTVAGN